MMPNYEQRPPAGELEGIKVQVADLAPIVPDNNFRRAALEAMLGPFARRGVEEALTTAMPGFWERRAAELDDARPRRSDFNGRATSAALVERDRRLAEQAAACLERAELIRRYPEDFSLLLGVPELVADVWAEGVAA